MGMSQFLSNQLGGQYRVSIMYPIVCSMFVCIFVWVFVSVCSATVGTVAKQVRQARQPQGTRAGYRQEVRKSMFVNNVSAIMLWCANRALQEPVGVCIVFAEPLI